MTRTTSLLFLLAVLGCQSPPAHPGQANAIRHPDPVSAIGRCRGALEQASAEEAAERARIVSVGCSELYVEADCRDAMREAWQLAPEMRSDFIARVCANAYCPLLPEPSPALCRSEPLGSTDLSQRLEAWREFRESMLRFDLGEPGATLARELSSLHRPSAVSVEGPRSTEATESRLTLRLSPTSTGLTIALDDVERTVTEENLREAVAALSASHCAGDAPTIAVVADAQLPYRVLVATLEGLSASGCSSVVMEVGQ